MVGILIIIGSFLIFGSLFYPFKYVVKNQDGTFSIHKFQCFFTEAWEQNGSLNGRWWYVKEHQKEYKSRFASTEEAMKAYKTKLSESKGEKFKIQKIFF